RGQAPIGPQPAPSSGFRAQKKTAGRLIDAWQALWDPTRSAFRRQQRTFDRTRRLALSHLVCLGRHTLTRLIAASGGHDRDWSADFRLFERARFQPADLFRTARQAVEAHLPEGAPFVALMDDTLFRKRGRKAAVGCSSIRLDPSNSAFLATQVESQKRRPTSFHRATDFPSPQSTVELGHGTALFLRLRYALLLQREAPEMPKLPLLCCFLRFAIAKLQAQP
ncbi:MAG: hypothetical protein AB1656_05625, partial [Candidatus Omnitrophota bacterium]